MEERKDNIFLLDINPRWREKFLNKKKTRTAYEIVEEWFMQVNRNGKSKTSRKNICWIFKNPFKGLFCFILGRSYATNFSYSNKYRYVFKLMLIIIIKFHVYYSPNIKTENFSSLNTKLNPGLELRPI